MSVETTKNDSLDNFPKITSKYNHDNNDNKNNIYRINKSYDNSSNIISPRRIRLHPINLLNLNKIEKKVYINEIINDNNSNIINNNIKIFSNRNKKLNKLQIKHTNIIPNDEKLKINDYNNKQKHNIFSYVNNQVSNRVPSNKKKFNLLFSRNYSNISTQKTNINLNKRNFSLDNLSYVNDTKENNNSLNDNKNSNNHNNNSSKKVLSSRPKSISSENIFISNVSLNSDRRSGRVRKLTGKIYNKKWNLPKVISFDKITGRYKDNKNPIKHHYFERMYDYNPNYDLILSNDRKAYVNMGNDDKNKFKNYKINMTRKYLCNQKNIINNAGDYYNILNVIKEEKEKKKKMKAKILEKQFNFLEEFNLLINKNKNNSKNIIRIKRK